MITSLICFSVIVRGIAQDFCSDRVYIRQDGYRCAEVKLNSINAIDSKKTIKVTPANAVALFCSDNKEYVYGIGEKVIVNNLEIKWRN